MVEFTNDTGIIMSFESTLTTEQIKPKLQLLGNTIKEVKRFNNYNDYEKFYNNHKNNIREFKIIFEPKQEVKQ